MVLAILYDYDWYYWLEVQVFLHYVLEVNLLSLSKLYSVDLVDT